MEKHLFYICLAVILLVLFMLFSCLFLSVFMEYQQRYQDYTLTSDGECRYQILPQTDNRACLAAAECLAAGIRDATGAQPRISSRREAGQACILVELAQAGQAEAPLYSVELQYPDIRIALPEGSEYAAMKAICARWLSPDCGLRSDGELSINLRMIREELSDLPLTLDGTFRILTQNLRYDGTDGGNGIPERAERFLRLLDDYRPDLICLQEASYPWMLILEDALADRYAFCKNTRPGSQFPEEWNVILYRSDRFSCLDQGVFSLSETPEIPGTHLGYSGYPRTCIWTILRDRQTGHRMSLGTTHLQNGAVETFGPIRTRQAEILLETFRQQNLIGDCSSFLLGDFNARSSEEYYTVITGVYRDARLAALHDSSAVDYSFQGYGTYQSLIDQVFFDGDQVRILDYRILDDQYDGYISDHYGILTTVYIE